MRGLIVTGGTKLDTDARRSLRGSSHFTHLCPEEPGAGGSRLAGVDEVGRGPLAGPVVAAAVILPHDFDTTGIADSKTLVARRRRDLAEHLLRHAVVGLAYVPASTIDQVNIHKATLLAMRRAVEALPNIPDHVLCDGRFVPSGLPCPGDAIVKGDSLVSAIAAASIVAKVARDTMMAEAEALFPGYGFARHMGYPTPEHRAALRRFGPCALHRMSFAPCQTAIL